MGKKKRVAEKSVNPQHVAKANEEQASESGLLKSGIESVALPTLATTAAFLLGADEETGRRSFAIRLVLSMFLDSVYGIAINGIIRIPARAVARRLPGAFVPAGQSECKQQEETCDDTTLVWPLPGTELPPEWIEAATKRRREEKGEPIFFLNHVRGSTRLRQAMCRISSAAGTLLMLIVMTRWVDHCDLVDIGLQVSVIDLTWGFLVGSFVIIILFCTEVALGWIRVVRYGEVVVPGELLLINLLWDVFFHVGVSINEELSMRGWILVHTAGCIAAMGTSASTAMILSASLQAGLFAFAHHGSPGASRVGLMNLVVGGSAAALNVFLSGGLSFSLGWHFGWNIFMGHLLGLSTSGIPMSAKLISIVPHPDKAHLHGGRFGPEQSPLAPAAYVLGCAALVFIYGLDGVDVWRERLVTINS